MYVQEIIIDHKSSVSRKILINIFIYQVFPFFKMSEDNKDIGRIPGITAKYHGTNGPMTVERYELFHDMFLYVTLFSQYSAYDSAYNISK